MVRFLVVVGLLGACTTHVGQAQDPLTSCIDLPAVADATLSPWQPFKNFGDRRTLRAGLGEEAVMRFDLSAIPGDAAITSSTLGIYVSDADANRPISLHRAKAAWQESTVSFLNFFQRFAAQEIGSIVVNQDNVHKSIDITPLTREWVAGVTPNNGVLFESTSLRVATFVSREGGTPAQQPSLQVCYTTPDDHCATQPCANGGACSNTTAGFTCACAPGYSGTGCETNIDDCAGNPCQNNGTCADGVDGYTCACAAGFSGQNCETDIDECATAPCQNGGICTDGVGAYTCTCPTGYTGTNCETLVDNCAANPCQHGTCSNAAGSYTCACETGYSGTNCEINIDDCSATSCHNNGTCVDGVASFSCVCPPDWGGELCDIDLNTCGQNPCLNGSTCTNGFGTYTCTCAAGFSGANCETDINDCASAPCQHNGVCVDGVASYTCTCAAGFSGANCEDGVGPASATTSSLVCAPLRLLADGQETADCTATFADEFNTRIVGAEMTWAVQCFGVGFTAVPCVGTSLSSAPNTTTNAAGSGGNGLQSTTVQYARISATVGGLTLSQTAAYLPVASPKSIASHGGLFNTDSISVATTLPKFGLVSLLQIAAPETVTFRGFASTTGIGSSGIAAGMASDVPFWAVANQSTNNVTVFEPGAPGQTLWVTLVDGGPAPSDLATVDVDGDQNDDLAVISRDADTIAYYFNSATGFTTTPRLTLATGSHPRAIARGTAPGQSMPFVAVANEGDDTVTIHQPFCFVGCSDLGTTIQLPSSAHPLALALHTDGNELHLFVAEPGLDRIEVFRVSEDTNFVWTVALIQSTTVATPTTLALGAGYQSGAVTLLAVGSELTGTVSIFTLGSAGLTFASSSAVGFPAANVIFAPGLESSCADGLIVTPPDGYSRQTVVPVLYTSCPIQ